jgi:hypothetical protein
MLCSLATKLDQGQIQEIESLEKDLGTPILAFACHQMDAAPMDAAQVDRLKELEDRLGVLRRPPARLPGTGRGMSVSVRPAARSSRVLPLFTCADVRHFVTNSTSLYLRLRHVVQSRTLTCRYPPRFLSKVTGPASPGGRLLKRTPRARRQECSSWP